MKKILLIFTLLVFNIFSWEVVEQVDSFGDKTGSSILSKKSEEEDAIIAILKSDKNEYSFAINSTKFLGRDLAVSYRAYDKDNNILQEYEGRMNRNIPAVSSSSYRFFIMSSTSFGKQQIETLLNCFKDENVHKIRIATRNKTLSDSNTFTFYTEGFDISLIN